MKPRRKFTREFKLSVLRQLESGNTVAEITRENSITASMLSKWKRQHSENPKAAFSGNGNIGQADAKIANYERLIGQLYSENAFLKKALASLESKWTEYRRREQQS